MTKHAKDRLAHITRRGRVTPDERDLIATLAEEGVKPEQIALRLGRHPATVNYHYVILGFRPARPGPGNGTVYDCRPTAGSRKQVRRFSPAEDRFIERLGVQGLKHTEIGQRCAVQFGYRRRPNSIYVRLMMLGAREGDSAA